MFQYSNSIPEDAQKKMLNSDAKNLVKVLYMDTNPLLENYTPQPCVLPESFKTCAQEIKDFKVRKDDVFTIGYTKTGSTLTAELISILMNGLDFEKIDREPLLERVPFLEMHGMIANFPIQNFLSIADSITHRRVMRTHLPVNLLPTDLLSMEGPKVVYVARNPKDAAISAFHYFKNLFGFEGSLNDLLECYLEGYTFYGSQFQHMEEYIRVAKLKNNLLVITFEDLVTNPVQVVRRVADFLEFTLSDEDAIKVAAYISFDKMKKRENSNFHELVDFNAQRNVKTDFKFQRKGEKGSYKTEMPKEFIERFNEEMRKWKDVMTLYPNC